MRNFPKGSCRTERFRAIITQGGDREALKEVDEKTTLATFFKICSCCGQPKEQVTDYWEESNRQGFCSDCASELSLEE